MIKSWYKDYLRSGWAPSPPPTLDEYKEQVRLRMCEFYGRIVHIDEVDKLAKELGRGLRYERK